MKFVKNIAIVVCASSFMFAGIGFHMANNYGTLEDGATVTSSWGVTYDLNDNTSVGWDANLGMLMMFDVPMGVNLRLGWTASVADACSGGASDGTENEAACQALIDGGDADVVWGGGNAASTSIGLGYTWWSGGEGLNTSISTNYDYIMAPNAADFAAGGDDNYSNLSVTVGFGF
tara:strand:+ start:98 stop:622 length:525 start_codon:yes stop_codon:yes gene_type:complete